MKRNALFLLISCLLITVSGRTFAQCASPLLDPDFEQQRARNAGKPWVSEGAAGIDIGLKFSKTGRSNAFMRASQGWNAIRQQIRLQAGTLYTLTAWVRTSNNVKEGFFGFRDVRQRVKQEVKFSSFGQYTRLQVRFRPAQTTFYNIFIGIWAPGQDAWAQVDSFSMSFPCNDTALIPADVE